MTHIVKFCFVFHLLSAVSAVLLRLHAAGQARTPASKTPQSCAEIKQNLVSHDNRLCSSSDAFTWVSKVGATMCVRTLPERTQTQLLHTDQVRNNKRSLSEHVQLRQATTLIALQLNNRQGTSKAELPLLSALAAATAKPRHWMSLRSDGNYLSRTRGKELCGHSQRKAKQYTVQ